mgnify:CR=1 FL=1
MDERWKTNPGCVYNVSYHIIWCTKYRRKLLLGEVEERLRSLLIEKATANGWDIPELEIMPDHVHLFIRSKPTYAVHFVVNQLKGYSSVKLRKEFPKLKSRLPTLWTRSYFVESVGHISEDTMKKYIENQKNV